MFWPDIQFGPINLWKMPKMDNTKIPMTESWYEPEGCDECGCPPGDFGPEDWDSGHYKCPECGAVC